MKKDPNIIQYEIPEQPKIKPPAFDSYDKNNAVLTALGSSRQRNVLEQADLRSVNYAPGVSGFRITPTGIEINDFSLAPASVDFTLIQNISSSRLLGRTTVGSGSIEQITIGSGLTLAAGVLSVDATSIISLARAVVNLGDVITASDEIVYI